MPYCCITIGAISLSAKVNTVSQCNAIWRAPQFSASLRILSRAEEFICVCGISWNSIKQRVNNWITYVTM